MPMDWMSGWMQWGMMIGMLLLIVVLVAAIVGGVWLIGRAIRGGGEDGGDRRGRASGPGRSPALEILEERYARGEIDHEEFERRRRVLGG